jgi:hypothetical protein
MFSTRASTTRADKRERAALANDARQSEKQEAIPGLPQEVVITHILRSENLADPTDLARLCAVSRGMCEAVTATGREIKEMIQQEAAQHGCLSTLIHLFRRGRLFRKKICETAARFGQLETLRWARAKGCPWGARTCAFAAEGGHLEVLQWADEKRCPWDERTCKYAAMGGHLEVLHWARAPVERKHVLVRGAGRPPRGAAVGASERLPVERVGVRVRGKGRKPRDAAVGARERLSVGRDDVRAGEKERTRRTTKLGNRLPSLKTFVKTFLPEVNVILLC